MTLDKFILGVFAVLCISSCGNGDDDSDAPIGNEGYHLVFVNRPSETLNVSQNTAQNSEKFLLQLRVMSKLKESSLDSSAQPYAIAGDQTIERLLKDVLDPTGERYNGTTPITIEYRTETCKDIKISLYNKDGSFLSDITDEARFYYETNPLDIGEAIYLFDEDRNYIGQVEEGATIADYLSHKPLTFPHACFSFPNLSEEFITEGNYIQVEILLGNGVRLTASLSK